MILPYTVDCLSLSIGFYFIRQYLGRCPWPRCITRKFDSVKLTDLVRLGELGAQHRRARPTRLDMQERPKGNTVLSKN